MSNGVTWYLFAIWIKLVLTREGDVLTKLVEQMTTLFSVNTWSNFTSAPRENGVNSSYEMHQFPCWQNTDFEPDILMVVFGNIWVAHRVLLLSISQFLWIEPNSGRCRQLNHFAQFILKTIEHTSPVVCICSSALHWCWSLDGSKHLCSTHASADSISSSNNIPLYASRISW